MATDPIGHLVEAGDAPRAAKHDTSPAPPPANDVAAAAHLTRRGTFRMAAPRSAHFPDEGELKNVEQIRELIKSPRCFVRPAIVQLDSSTGRAIATHDLAAVGSPAGLPELLHSEAILGSSSEAHIAVRAEGVEPRHARAIVRRDRRLEIRLVDAVPLSTSALTIDGVSSPWGGQLLHGSRFTLASATLSAIDLAVTDDPAVRRASAARLSLHDAFGVELAKALPIHSPLTVVGSSAACDYVVPGLADAHAVLWLRGDGRFELIDLDTSVLPHGDPVASASILSGSTRIPLPGGRVLHLDDPVVAPAERAPRSTRDDTRQPQPAVVARAPEATAPALRADRLVVCGKRAGGLRSDLRESYDVTSRRIVIGSDRRCDIVVDHEWVSPRHVELAWSEAGRYVVKDLGSKRGTSINRKRCPGGSLADGDYLDVGGAVSLRLERGHGAPPEGEASPSALGSLLGRLGLARRDRKP